MPTIQITSGLGVVINAVAANPNPGSAFAKYLQGHFPALLLPANLVSALNNPVATSAATPVSFGLNTQDSLTLGNVNPEITITAGAQAAVHVNAAAGSNLFAGDPFGSPFPVPPGVGYVSLALTGTVDPGVSVTSGDLTFGVDTSGSIQFEYFRAFATDPAHPTVAEALGEVISNYVIPADLDDLKQLRPNDACTVSGKGKLTVSGSVNLAAAVNPLASIQIPLMAAPVQVQSGVTLTVGASYAILGGYQIRVRRTGANTVELGFFKQAGQQWTVDVAVAAGVEADHGGKDLLVKLLQSISKTPQADIKTLTQGGLTTDEIQKINDAIAAGIARSLKASLDLELSLLQSHEAAFLYEVDLGKLESKGGAAVNLALDGDLSALYALEMGATSATLAPGIRLVRSRFSEIQQKSTSLKVNLLGILNVSSLSQLIQQSDFVYDPATGDLTISVTTENRQIGAFTDRGKIRKAHYDSVLVTTVYRASGIVEPMALHSSDAHFVTNQTTARQTMSRYLDGFVALELMDTATRNLLLAGFTGTGASTCLLRTEFDDAACEALFLDGADQLFDEEHYQRIGRDALIALLPPGDEEDPGSLRRATLASDADWNAMQLVGSSQAIAQALGAPRNAEPTLSVIISDFLMITWWADAMRSAGKKLLAMRQFLAAAGTTTFPGSNEFTRLRKDLERHMAGVVANSKVHFGSPWGMVALFEAAKPKAQASAVLVSPKLSRFAPDHSAANAVGAGKTA